MRWSLGEGCKRANGCDPMEALGRTFDLCKFPSRTARHPMLAPGSGRGSLLQPALLAGTSKDGV
jgi:hypothetical protein